MCLFEVLISKHRTNPSLSITELIFTTSTVGLDSVFIELTGTHSGCEETSNQKNSFTNRRNSLNKYVFNK